MLPRSAQDDGLFFGSASRIYAMIFPESSRCHLPDRWRGRTAARMAALQFLSDPFPESQIPSSAARPLPAHLLLGASTPSLRAAPGRLPRSARFPSASAARPSPATACPVRRHLGPLRPSAFSALKPAVAAVCSKPYEPNTPRPKTSYDAGFSFRQPALGFTARLESIYVTFITACLLRRLSRTPAGPASSPSGPAGFPPAHRLHRRPLRAR